LFVAEADLALALSVGGADCDLEALESAGLEPRQVDTLLYLLMYVAHATTLHVLAGGVFTVH
jgi:hypothetical protein